MKDRKMGEKRAKVSGEYNLMIDTRPGLQGRFRHWSFR